MMNEQTEMPHANVHDRTSRRVTTLLVVVSLYLAFSIVLPLHSFDFAKMGHLTRAMLIVVPTLIFMFLQILLSLSIVRLRLTSLQLLALAVVSSAAWCVMLFFFFHTDRPLPYEEVLLLRLSHYALLGIALTFCLTSLGCLLSLIIRERNILLPVALIAMPIDYLGAMTPAGFTHDMVEHASKIVDKVSVSVPTVTVHGFTASPIAYIGPGDVLFMALFFAAVQRFNLNERATFWWMYALLSLSMVLVVSLKDFPIGALVPMGLAVIIANGNSIKLKREEAFAVAYAGAFILVLVGLFFSLSHRYLFHSH